MLCAAYWLLALPVLIETTGLTELTMIQRTMRDNFNSDDLVFDHAQHVHANGPGQIYTVPSVNSLYTHWNDTILGGLFGEYPMYPGIEACVTCER